jgi:hypothetical protein
MTVALGRNAARDGPEAAVFNAPLFHRLLEQMNDDARRVVLDLGPARPETVATFGRFRCRLDIASLAEGIDALNGIKDATELAAAMIAVLPPRRAEPTHVVLCWDLLNYLERPVLAALMAELAGRLVEGSLVHALIAYSTPRIAAKPGRIVPADGQQLSFSRLTAEDRPAQRYTPDELSRCMPGYRVDRVMLLRNGMQEFLFRR